MRALVVCLGLLTACYSPRLRAGAQCAVEQECPDPLHCVAGRCEYGNGPPVDAALPDAAPDASVVDAAIDAGGCEVAPPAQHDEDRDGAFDAVDPCPLVLESVPSDSDGDGVSDRCDRGGALADLVLWFETFQCGVPPTGWSTTNVISERDAVTVGSSRDGAIGALGTPDQLPDHATGSFLFTIAASPQTDQFVEASIGSFSDPDHIITCTLDTREAFVAIDEEMADGSVRRLDSSQVTLDPGRRQILRMGRDGTTYRCDVIDAAGNVTALAGVAVKAESDDMNLRFATYGVSAAMDAVLVVGRRP